MFNDENSELDVLVASDAIGMGLNLNISRIIFSTLKKFDGVEMRDLSVSEIKQIAGKSSTCSQDSCYTKCFICRTYLNVLDSVSPCIFERIIRNLESDWIWIRSICHVLFMTCSISLMLPSESILFSFCILYTQSLGGNYLKVNVVCMSRLL